MTSQNEIRTVAPHALDAQPLAALWNAAYGDDLAVSASTLEWATQVTSRRQATAIVALSGGAPAGFLLASTLAGVDLGWIDGLATRKGRGQSRLRSALMDRAQEWLLEQGCTICVLGGGARSLFRGSLPQPGATRALQSLGFGFSTLGEVADMVVDVARYRQPDNLAQPVGVVRTATPRDREEILALLDSPTLYSAASGDTASAAEIDPLRELCEPAGRLADLMLLWTAHGLQGACQVVFSDSAFPIEISYPYSLPRQWSMLRSVVVAQALAEDGPALLMDATLRRLHNNGANSCVAPGIAATHDYAHFGFRPYRRWRPMTKRLGAHTV
jgi:GNAT superfamily N-acetyltransferase/predicted N-acetyltransferase YhbS